MAEWIPMLGRSVERIPDERALTHPFSLRALAAGTEWRNATIDEIGERLEP